MKNKKVDILKGRAVEFGPYGVKGVSMGWANELDSEGRQTINTRMWDVNERVYKDFNALPEDLRLDKEPDMSVMSKGDWERLPDYIAMCVDLALATHDEKWFNQLMRLKAKSRGPVALLLLRQAEREQAKEMAKKETIVKKFEPKRLSAPVPEYNGIKLGDYVKDTRNNMAGIVTGFETRTSNLLVAKVRFFNKALRRYVVYERKLDVLEVTEPANITETDVKTESFDTFMREVAQQLAVNTKDRQWFEEHSDKRKTEVE